MEIKDHAIIALKVKNIIILFIVMLLLIPQKAVYCLFALLPLLISANETIKEPTSPEDWKFGWNDPGDIGYKDDHGAYLLTLAEPINVLNN